MSKSLLVMGLFVSLASLLLVQGSGASQAKAPRVPRIVAQAAVTNQVNPIPNTTLFNVQSSGLFRASAHVLTRDYNCLQDPVETVIIGWNDDLRARNLSSAVGSSYGSGVVSWTFVFRAVQGTSIQYWTGTPACTPYDLYITLEQLH